MAKKHESSLDSMAEASRSRAEFSGHGAALGAAGYRVASDHPANCEFLENPGDFVAVNPHEENFESLMIGLAWDNILVEESGFFGKMFKKARKVGVDLDIGCLYELENGKRGCIQAFGEKFGDFEQEPFISLSGDERTGDVEGHDEYLLVNTDHWTKIKRMLVYVYIYDGVPNWSQLQPQIVVDIPGEKDLYVTLKAHDDRLDVCAIAELEQIRGGIRLRNCTEYFPGHAEMDRAFGYGLEWADGKKEPL